MQRREMRFGTPHRLHSARALMPTRLMDAVGQLRRRRSAPVSGVAGGQIGLRQGRNETGATGRRGRLDSTQRRLKERKERRTSKKIGKDRGVASFGKQHEGGFYLVIFVSVHHGRGVRVHLPLILILELLLLKTDLMQQRHLVVARGAARQSAAAAAPTAAEKE